MKLLVVRPNDNLRPHAAARLALAVNVIVIASFLRRSLIVALTVAGTAAADVAHAQAGVSHAEDATPIPGGTLRMSIANVWTRYDSRFDSSGVTRPIGAYLSTDSLGPRQLPNLAPIEQALGVLTGDARTRLTFGRLDVRSDARIVRTPIALEYGVTRRLSIGVLLPLVQTRRTAQARVNLDTALAVRSNVGIVPSTGRADVATANLAAVTALNAASAQITQLLSRCQQSPGAAECDPVRGREAAAAAAASSASAFATAVGTAYGTTPQTAIVAPRSASPLAAQIEARRAALVTQLRAFVPSATVSPLFTAPTELSYADFQGRNGVAGLLQSRYGGGLDSIRTTERVHIGDVIKCCRIHVKSRRE